MKHKTLPVLFALGAILVSANAARARPPNIFEILTGFSANETCGCAFVVNQTDAYCTAFGMVDGYNVAITIDRTAANVTATSAGVVRTARFTPSTGCLLDALP